MSGTFLTYKPGRIDARFSHDQRFDYINLDIFLDGDITVTTDCDDEFRLATPENHKKENVEFQVYMSSVFCPFGDFIRFLEAITLEVQECSFTWDSEGPEGRMRWERRSIHDTGFLTVEWNSSKTQFSHRMMLKTQQAVGALYTAFRAFAESPEYDPLRYERLTIGNGIALVLSDASLDDLAGAIVVLDAIAAETVVQRLRNAMGERRDGELKRSFPIRSFLEPTGTIMPSGEFYQPWICPEWDSWDFDQRFNDLNELFDGGASSWYGANLRELRSRLVEDWLASPELPPPERYEIRSPT